MQQRPFTSSGTQAPYSSRSRACVHQRHQQQRRRRGGSSLAPPRAFTLARGGAPPLAFDKPLVTVGSAPTADVQLKAPGGARRFPTMIDVEQAAQQ
jgi:hypothetical protein